MIDAQQFIIDSAIDKLATAFVREHHEMSTVSICLLVLLLITGKQREDYCIAKQESSIPGSLQLTWARNYPKIPLILYCGVIR